MSGALALKLALKVLDGDKSVSKEMVIPLWAEMRDGCNVFDPKMINSDYVDNIYSPMTPEVGLAAAMAGTPEPRAK